MSADHPTTAAQVANDGATERPELKLLLVATSYHLASQDLRNLIKFLKSEECASR